VSGKSAIFAGRLADQCLADGMPIRRTSKLADYDQTIVLSEADPHASFQQDKIIKDENFTVGQLHLVN